MEIRPGIDVELGDCMELMGRMPDGSVDLVLCDPPYGATVLEWDSVLPAEELWRHYRRLLSPKGSVVLFGTGLFAFRLALSNEGWFRYDMVWRKSKCGSPLTAKYMPLKKHESILVFGNPAAYYEPQMTQGAPYRRAWTPSRVNNLKYGIAGVETDNKGTRHPTTVLDFPQKWRRQDQVHPTQKPVELMEWLVRSYCPPGGLVLDNCMGSGTTGVACVNAGRRFMGVELDKGYFDIAVGRIREAVRLDETRIL